VADICKRNNIKELKWKGDKSLVGQIAKQNMTVHRWFSATACPGDYLYSKHADIATKVNALLKPAPKVETTSKTLYRVQVGAYSKKENADAMAKKLKSLGFDAIITTVSK
jgi:cell division septation protein DedD